jgi:hypothetical protein
MIKVKMTFLYQWRVTVGQSGCLGRVVGGGGPDSMLQF